MQTKKYKKKPVELPDPAPGGIKGTPWGGLQFLAAWQSGGGGICNKAQDIQCKNEKSAKKGLKMRKKEKIPIGAPQECALIHWRKLK